MHMLKVAHKCRHHLVVIGEDKVGSDHMERGLQNWPGCPPGSSCGGQDPVCPVFFAKPVRVAFRMINSHKSSSHDIDKKECAQTEFRRFVH